VAEVFPICNRIISRINAATQKKITQQNKINVQADYIFSTLLFFLSVFETKHLHITSQVHIFSFRIFGMQRRNFAYNVCFCYRQPTHLLITQQGWRENSFTMYEIWVHMQLKRSGTVFPLIFHIP